MEPFPGVPRAIGGGYTIERFTLRRPADSVPHPPSAFSQLGGERISFLDTSNARFTVDDINFGSSTVQAFSPSVGVQMPIQAPPSPPRSPGFWRRLAEGIFRSPVQV